MSLPDFERIKLALLQKRIRPHLDAIHEALDRLTGSDITEQKRAEKVVHDSEERYRTIFEGAPEGVWLIGADRKTIEVNRRISEILGYPREEMIGKTPLDFVDEENRKIFITQTGKIETTDRREYEIALRHKDGHNVPTFFSATTLRSYHPKTTGS